jgi:hypothetical protein
MKITEPSGRRRPGRRKAQQPAAAPRARTVRRRLTGSLAAGAVVAGALVAWEDLHNHAALAAAAAGPQPKGVHETVGSILATGGIATALVVTAVVFVIATMLARRRNARPAETPYPPVARPGRGRASARR